MMYKLVTASNAVGALLALAFLIRFLHRKEYSKFYQAFIILQCSGLSLLLAASIYMFNREDVPWVLRMFGLLFWTNTFVFIASMKVQFGDTEGISKIAKTLSDFNKDEALKLSDTNRDEAKKLADERFEGATKKVQEEKGSANKK